jgi:FixJ family two-component response regulator
MRQCTVFLVTEDQKTIGLITKAGEGIGCEVEVYRGSICALNALYDNPWRCDLLIADESMTDLPGSFIAERLLKMRAMADVILLVTREDIEMDLDTKTRSSGVRCIVAKPSLSKANVSFSSNFAGPN